MKDMKPPAQPGEYSLRDLMTLAAAREVRDNEMVTAGSGMPMIAIMLAQRTHAPRLKLIFEAGTLDGRAKELPTSVRDPRCEVGASVASGLYEALSIVQRGDVDLGFLGGAEIDEYGNVNTTAIDDYLNPLLRLTGSGGNPDTNSFAKRTVYIMVHEKAFSQKCQLHHKSRIERQKLAIRPMDSSPRALWRGFSWWAQRRHQHSRRLSF
nr:CoA-transferase [Desulfosoma caldarium]